VAVRGASNQAASIQPAQKPPPRGRFAKIGCILSSPHSTSRWSQGGRRRPTGQTVIAIFTAVALVAVGTGAGIKIKQYKAPPSIQTIRIGKSGTDTLKGAGDPLTTSTGAPVASKAKAAAVPAVAPLQNRVDPDLFLTSTSSLTLQQMASVTRATGAIRVLAVDYAQVKLGKGVTAAVGVDPSTFRQYTPDNTAPVDALWQRVASGDAAVAHAVALALQIKLGGHTVAGRTIQRDVRVGAFATTRLPGIGVVVDRSKSAALGLVHGAALILVLPKGADPLVALSSALEALPTAKVQALRYSTGAIGTTPGGPVVPGGVPILGRGWTLPLRLGTFTLTQRYGFPNGHPGIDLAAPWGTPIYAAAEGDVLYWGPAQGFGNWIVLQHPGGIQTVYGHMRADELLIGPTAHVQAGQLIARVGSEGNSTGPHLHFEVHINNVRTDPIAFLNAEGVNEIG
jgi:murein DD-endopeptidase MepM/ murein hydrolase activator NlpD